MSKDDLEQRCQKAVIRIAEHVKDINYKLSHFLENYREDYYDTLEGIGYQKQLKQYRK
ncbi:MAG: hypothetical protein KAV87_53390 [Desulfobacteraceae bacterium]|nr:hypothetical protein [Desulfobacteraceae bacterium]